MNTNINAKIRGINKEKLNQVCKKRGIFINQKSSKEVCFHQEVLSYINISTKMRRCQISFGKENQTFKLFNANIIVKPITISVKDNKNEHFVVL